MEDDAGQEKVFTRPYIWETMGSCATRTTSDRKAFLAFVEEATMVHAQGTSGCPRHEVHPGGTVHSQVPHEYLMLVGSATTLQRLLETPPYSQPWAPEFR